MQRERLAPSHIAAQVRGMTTFHKALKGFPLGADGGVIAMTWVEFRTVWPREYGLAQRPQALDQRLRRSGVTRSTGKDGVADDGLSIEAQAHAACCVTANVDNRYAAASHFYLCAVQQGKVGIYAKGFSVSGMNTHQDASGQAHGL